MCWRVRWLIRSSLPVKVWFHMADPFHKVKPSLDGRIVNQIQIRCKRIIYFLFDEIKQAASLGALAACNSLTGEKGSKSLGSGNTQRRYSSHQMTRSPLFLIVSTTGGAINLQPRASSFAMVGFSFVSSARRSSTTPTPTRKNNSSASKFFVLTQMNDCLTMMILPLIKKQVVMGMNATPPPAGFTRSLFSNLYTKSERSRCSR